MAEYVVDLTNVSTKTVRELTGSEAIECLWGLPVRERIVRCMDCKYATPDTSGRKRYKGYLWCDKLTEGIGFSVAPSDFCAWGERKEVDE